MGDAKGRKRSVLATAPQGGCSLSTAIPRAPRASGPGDPPQDKADHHKDSSEQDERERVGPGTRDHRGTRFRRAMRRSRSPLSPRNTRALAHRIMQAGTLVWGEVREISHMKRTVAASNSVNVSTALTIAPRHRAFRWPHRSPPALETNRLLVPGPRTWTIASAVAVVAHRQRPPKSHATTRGPIEIMKPDVAPVMPSTR
jgi:hypothetical protein